MRCRRSDEIDVGAFLANEVEDSTNEQIRDFRDHYPTCEACSAAVGKWSALDLALRDVVDERSDGSIASVHFESEELAAFVEGREELGARAAMIESHLSECDSCRTEVAAMTRFDPSALLAALPVAVEDERLAVSGKRSAFDLVGRLSDRMAGSRAGGFSPAWGGAFALAATVVLALGIWWALGTGRGGMTLEPSPGSGPRIVERPAPPSGSPQEPGNNVGGVPGTETEARPERLAETTRSRSEGPVENGSPAGDDRDRRASDFAEPAQLAQVSPERTTPPAPTGGTPPTSTTPSERAEQPEAPAAGDEILLAALTDMPPLNYARPAGGRAQTWMRQFGPIRSGGRERLVEVLAPLDHVGRTLDETPRLWWSVVEETAVPIQVTIVDEEAIDPILRIEIPGPHSPGLESIDLAAYDIELESGIEYRWFVSALVDPERPSRNPTSAGALEVVESESPLRSEIDDAAQHARGHRLAELGIWYDAYDFFASLAARHPDASRVVAERDRLAKAGRSGTP